jgi:hypothetical protein
MRQEWNSLTDLTGKREYVVTSVRLNQGGVEIRGEFELPPLAKLSYEDQVFVAEFIRNHGSIKQMEQRFGVSYPTIKNRLNAIAHELKMVAVQPVQDKKEVLDMLERGEISAGEAAQRLSS